jgi:hypothetical protein
VGDKNAPKTDRLPIGAETLQSNRASLASLLWMAQLRTPLGNGYYLRSLGGSNQREISHQREPYEEGQKEPEDTCGVLH